MKQRFVWPLVALFAVGFVGCITTNPDNGGDNGNDNGDVNTNGVDNGNDNGVDNSNDNGDDNSNDNGDDNSNDNGDDNSNDNGDDNGNDNGMTGADAAAGQSLFVESCSGCHGADATGGAVYPDSIRGSDAAEIDAALMLAIHESQTLSDDDVANVEAFLSDM
jgi:hypothetical protein